MSSSAQHEWAEARKASDFNRFRPWLERLAHLNREKARCYGIPAGGETWDALADGYEPGCRAADVERVFRPLREQLTGFIDRLMASPVKPSNRFNETAIAIDRQERFVRVVAESIGFDFSRGRLDRSTHPFCGGSHCNGAGSGCGRGDDPARFALLPRSGAPDATARPCGPRLDCQ